MAKENNNKSFVLRIDAATMDALELWAADEFRSINGQLQWIIADALRRSGRLKKLRPAKARPRCRMPSLPLPQRQPGKPARCLRTPVCSPTTRKKIKPI